MNHSNLFQPGKTFGAVINQVPFTIQKLDTQNFLTACVGQSYIVYDCSNLRVALRSKEFAQPIEWISSYEHLNILGFPQEIRIFHKYQQYVRLNLPNSQLVGLCWTTNLAQEAAQLLVYAWTSTHLYVFDLPHWALDTQRDHQGVHTFEVSRQLELPAISHACMVPYLPHTLVVGHAEGCLLLNGLTLERDPIESAGRVRPSALCVNPVVPGLMASATPEGDIHVLHFMKDVQLRKFKDRTTVCALAFRQEKADDFNQILVSGNVDGELCVWDLAVPCLVHKVASSHGPLSSLIFLENEPILLSSGADNSVKQWIFDQADQTMRLLRFREGHPGPIHALKFYNSQEQADFGLGDNDLISVSFAQDQAYVGKTSFVQDQLNRRWGTKIQKIPQKLSKVTSMASCHVRHFDWPAVLTTHENRSETMVWSAHKGALDSKKLEKDGDFGEATACALSFCGNFAVVGYATGEIQVFSAQSGHWRGSFRRYRDEEAWQPEDRKEAVEETPQTPTEKKAAKPFLVSRESRSIEYMEELVRKKRKVEDISQSMAALPVDFAPHAGALIYLSFQETREVLSVSMADSRVQFWELESRGLNRVWNFPGSQTFVLAQECLNFLALGLSDGQVILLDKLSFEIIRTFQEAQNQRLTALAFSPHAKYLVVSSHLGHVYVYDILGDLLADRLQFWSPVLTLNFHPNNAFLITTHEDSPNCFAWCLKNVFGAEEEEEFRDELFYFSKPNEEMEVGEAQESDRKPKNKKKKKSQTETPSAVPLRNPGLLTASKVSLRECAQIREARKTEEAFEKDLEEEPQDAPFFLKFTEKTPDLVKDKWEKKPECFQVEPRKVGAKLEVSEDPVKLLDSLKERRPHQIYWFFSDLDEEGMACLLKFFAFHLKAKHEAHLIQSYLSLFLDVHMTSLVDSPALNPALRELETLQTKVFAPQSSVKTLCYFKSLAHLLD